MSLNLMESVMHLHLIIAGGRDFNDYQALVTAVDAAIVGWKATEVTIISGMARGADALGVRYAKECELPLIEMPADWDRWGKSAGFKRNLAMAKRATHLIAFWNGKSIGTQHMINIAKAHGLVSKVVSY